MRIDISTNKSKLIDMVDQLSSEFKGTMGYVRVYVSLHIHKDYELKLLYINQTWYIVQIIVKFGLANAHG
jgi:hypothetical protein